jgi:hypothetical protein
MTPAEPKLPLRACGIRHTSFAGIRRDHALSVVRVDPLNVNLVTELTPDVKGDRFAGLLDGRDRARIGGL